MSKLLAYVLTGTAKQQELASAALWLSDRACVARSAADRERARRQYEALLAELDASDCAFFKIQAE